MTSDKLQDLYRSAEGVRGHFDNDEQRATLYFQRYVDFVTRSAPLHSHPVLLDIGCGAGWSSYSFAKRGYQVTGVDLNQKAFEPPSADGLTLREASVLDLPFGDASFDVVTCYQTLEHVPDPRAALLQMFRVCKPGGVLCVVGPNLVSIGQSLKGLFFACQNRPLRRIFLRAPGMPRHPYGNTLWEAVKSVPLSLGRVILKTLASEPDFSMRQPDLVPPFFADNDACYLCNPIDLVKFLPKNGCRIVQNGAYGRPPFTASLAGGTWIAACKENRPKAERERH